MPPISIGPVARMVDEEPVSDAPPDEIELDAVHHVVAVRRDAVVPIGQHLAFKHLDLQRHRKSVLNAPGAEADEALARLEQGSRGHRLQAVEVGEDVGVALVGPVEPCGHHRIALALGGD
ncbi:hypothetical protein ABIF93_005900 [Bradyrhizobium japonicum]|nr:hypothetical protein [Bradyrhizobium liaoningense]MBR1068296.1 hypothetical protein [Bradyrhizobium liaoningense]